MNKNLLPFTIQKAESVKKNDKIYLNTLSKNYIELIELNSFQKPEKLFKPISKIISFDEL